LARRAKKFLATKKFVLATKSIKLGASWPQGFFPKVEPWANTSFEGMSLGKLKMIRDALQ